MSGAGAFVGAMVSRVGAATVVGEWGGAIFVGAMVSHVGAATVVGEWGGGICWSQGVARWRSDCSWSW